ncbi:MULTISPECIES: hypothetical protein [Actinomycetes]|uniref:TrbL/VirB6 plasmid conjugal transfer protein n=1 Tax=Williamsia marianensis TaxID=85044 RepID=A0ABU4F067_WILMA|nr:MULTISPECIES: hypothetical protein [Actinomycetes]MDV7136891.1 hypothetical protein [Williamsia muralis]
MVGADPQRHRPAAQHSSPASWLRRLTIAVLVALALAVVVPSIPTPVTSPGVAHAVDTCDIVGQAANVLIPGVDDKVCDKAVDAAGAVSDPAGAVKDAANDGFKSMTESLVNGFSKMIQQSLTWFIQLPTPAANQWDPVQEIQQWTVQIQLLGLAASIVAGGIRLQLAKRQAVYAEGEELFFSLQRAVFGAWMFGGIMIGLTAGVDKISTKILELSVTDGTPVEAAKNMFDVANMMGYLGVGLVFVIAVVGILGALLQAILLVARQSMLIVVVAIIPIIGAASGTKMGKNAFSKTISWTIALLLWKPVAALTYSVAFMLAGTKSDDGAQILYGVLLLTLAAAVLPMLTKLVSGGMAMSGGSGLQAAMMTMGVVAAGGSIAAAGAGGGAGAGAGAGATPGGPATGGQAGAGGVPSGGGGGGGGGNRGGGGGGNTGGGGRNSSGSGSGDQQGSGGRSSATPSGATPTGAEAGASTPTGGASGSGGSGGSGSGGGGSTMADAVSNVSGAMQMSQAAEDFFDDNAPAMAGEPR